MSSSAIILPEQSPERSKRIALFGATGTIGKNTLELIRNKPEFNLELVTSHHNVAELASIAREFNVKHAVIADETHYDELKNLLVDSNIEVSAGSQALQEAAALPCDITVMGIVGAAALGPTLKAVQQGCNIALANKECLVCAGDLIMSEAKKHGASILPVDSEHNAVFQLLGNVDTMEGVSSITLTASGGPFRDYSYEMLGGVTPAQAVKHPNWNMGAKISVDSATMMNKGLEIIEAYHLFAVEKEQIDAIVHPESIVHCLVQFTDGSTSACMSTPDMKVPLAYSLAWPERMKTDIPPLNLTEIGKLTFEAIDYHRFPAVSLAKQVLDVGGNAPCILNAANEIAVEAFLAEKIDFLSITSVVEHCLEQVASTKHASLDEVYEVDAAARDCAKNYIAKT